MADNIEVDAKQQEESPSKGKKPNKLILFGVPALILQIAVCYFIITKFMTNSAEAGGSEATVKEHKDESKMGELYTIDDVIVNPAETSGTRFLNVTVGLEVEDSGQIDFLTERELLVRNLLISILVSRTISQLDDGEDLEELRKEIKDKLNDRFGSVNVMNVYFSEYVMQ